MTQKKKTLSREQAAELYKDLQSSLAALKLKDAVGSGKNKKPATPAHVTRSSVKPAGADQDLAKSIAKSIKQGMGTEGASPRGQYLAVGFVMFFAAIKVALSAMEATGFATATPAEASMVAGSSSIQMTQAPLSGQGMRQFTKEEVTVLTSLDNRRAELEERGKRLDDRENDFNRRDSEYTTRLAQLKEMTETLKLDRDKNEKKRNTQLDQLANVYGSMDPKEAAGLIEQLDVTIALALVERMPEKRIGQILALMNPERALKITKMLSGKVG